MHWNARHKHPHTGGQCAGDQKKARRRFVRARTESIADEREGGIDFVFEIIRHHHRRKHQPAHGITQHHLNEAEIASLGKEHRGHPDKGERTGLGGHDGKGHAPPRQIAPAEEIIARRFLPAPEPHAQGDNARKIARDDPPIQRGKRG